MTNNYYDLLIKNVMLEIEKENYDLALELILKELSMPYIPLRIEEKLIHLRDELIVKTKKNGKKSSLSLEEVIPFLNSDDKIKVIQAVEALPSINLRNISNDLKKFIEKSDDRITIAFIFESLIEQKIDIDIKIDNKILNPAKEKSVLEDERIIKAIENIVVKTEKQPQITQIAASEFKRYLLNIYPNIPDDLNNISNSIIKIIRNSLEGKENLNEFDKKVLTKLK